MKKTYKVAIIGVGQLGSRYLQGLANTSLELSIEAVEPQAVAQSMARERFDEINCGKSKALSFHDSVDDLSSNLDLVIISTNSDVRASIIRQLIASKKVTALVLEKILFQKISDYHDIESLLLEKNIKVWVNHSRRLSPFYKMAKKMLYGSDQINFNVIGGGWGMACNSLHFLDIFSYLTSVNEINISTDNLSPEIVDAKRSGFKEVNGLLSGQLGPHNFSIQCMERSSPLSITICSDNVSFRIDESNGIYEIALKDTGWSWSRNKEKIVYLQSETTKYLVEDILLHGNCNLPTYLEAREIHIPFMAALLEHMNKSSSVKYDFCPIT